MMCDEKLGKTVPFAQASVEQMAARREARAREQREELSRGGDRRCVVCICMNIAGPRKRGGLIDAAFLDAVRCFFLKLSKRHSTAQYGAELRFINENTGIEALISLDADAAELKRICVEIEEEHQAGRLFDIDVIAKNGAKLGRSEPRKCLICSENASVCARSRAHSVQELEMRTREMLERRLADFLGESAMGMLMAEVNITPKPGLVDANNSGANTDMNRETFLRSALALRPFFIRMAELSIAYAEKQDDAAFEAYVGELKKLGVEAEKAMLKATGGVNTHRGAVYSLGLLVSAAALNFARGVFSADESGLRGVGLEELRELGGLGLAKNCTRTAAELACALGDNSEGSSNGAIVREKYGVDGPVQQAQQGFPLALLAKAAKEEYYNRYGSEHEELAWAYALIRVMAVMDDNNALKRGGRAGADYVKKRASELASFAMRADPSEFNAALLELDAELIERNISCGGAADMLALALFLDGLDTLSAPLERPVFNDERERGEKYVLISGEPGVGGTSFCKTLFSKLLEV